MSVEVQSSGSEIDKMVCSLICHANDKEESVRAAIHFAMHDIGCAQPLLVISSIAGFLSKNKNLEQNHRIVLLKQLAQLLEVQNARQAVADTCEDKAAVKNASRANFANSLIQFICKEMVSGGADSVSDISVPCSSSLVLLSGAHCSSVLSALLDLFPAGELPHYYIVKCFADCAANHPVAFCECLKEVMARMTPVIANIKREPMKWVFATAFGRFSEAMGHYQASCAENHVPPKITPASFEIHMASAFDVLFNNWMLQSSESKVRFACFESLGQMCALLDPAALEIRLPKLIMNYLNMYKKEKAADHMPISHGLCCSLKVAVNTAAIHQLVQPLLQNLHPLVCRPVDFATPATAKNHNELLRCWEVLARFDLEAVLQFVIGRFQLKERDSRVGSLIILRHFVNSLDDVLDDRKPLIMSSVLTLLTEQDLGVKKLIMQLIVSMANQNYLEFEGGQQLVKFILQQCALQVEEEKEAKLQAANPNATTPTQIRNAANHIINVMATKVPSARKVLWPYLIELIVEPDFNRAAVVIFRVLEHIASLKRSEEHPDYLINWEAQVNMPPPQAMLSRLMVLACDPFRKKSDAGLVMCKAMWSLGPLIHPSIGKYWDESVPSLIQHLEAHSHDTINTPKWQDTLLKMWKETVAVVDNVKWIQDLAGILGGHMKLYKSDPALLRCLHRYLGSVLAKVEARTVLQTGIDLMLDSVNHGNDVERQGCAQGLGLAASAHLDVVLPKLTERLNASMAQKKASGGFFGFGSSSKPTDIPNEQVVATVVLCYGYVAAYANPELILSRLEVHILHNLVPLVPKARSNLIKVHLIKAIDLIGKALHSSRLPDAKKNFKLSQRDELLTGLISFLDDKVVKAQGGKPSLEIRLLGVNAAATLANLEPPLPTALRSKLSEAVFPFYGLSAESAVEKDKSASSSAQPSNGQEEKTESPEGMLEMIVANLNTLLTTIIQMEATVPSLVDLLKLLEPWLCSDKSVERERSCASYLAVLKKFVSRCVHEKVAQSMTSIPELGHHLAQVLTRCNDSSITVRQTAAENVQALLYINQVLGNPDNPKPAHEIKLLTEIRNRLESTVCDDRLVVIRDLCSLLTAVVNVNELISVINNLFTGLTDSDLEAAQGAALILKTLLFAKASEITPAVKQIVTGILLAVKLIKVGEVAEISFAAFRILTRVHFSSVVGQLLDSPHPVPREVIDCCMALVETGPADPAQAPNRPVGMEPEWDEKLAKKTLLHFMDVINETPLEKDKPTPIVMAATCCIREMLRVESAKSLVESIYPDVLCTLLMRIGTASGVDKGNSSIDACGAVRSFLECMQEDVLLKKLDTDAVWPVLESANYDDGITTVTRHFSDVHGERKQELLQFLSKFYSQQSYTGQRIVATAMLAEFVNHSQSSPSLLRELIKFLLPRVADKVDKVRKQALRGLGHLVVVWSQETSAMATSVLSSLTAAAEDQHAEVAAEAVHSLTRIVRVVSEDLIGPMLISICFRLRPAFDRKEESVRGPAFTLFGALHRFGVVADNMDEGVRGNFLDQVHSFIPIFIVHTNDEQASVREAALNAFRELSPLLGVDFINVLSECTGEPSNYDELVQRMCPLLNQHHSSRLRGYLENTTQYFSLLPNLIKSNAAYLAGVLISTATVDQRRTISIPQLTSELIRLLDDPSAIVRARAAKALSLCHEL